MTSWQTSGCPIKFYSIKYKVWDDVKWTEVANHIDSNVIAYIKIEEEGVMVMVFSATFKNISDISLQSVLLVE
jgi:hypothetical protein